MNGHPEQGPQTAARNVEVRLVSWVGRWFIGSEKEEGSPDWSGHESECPLPVLGAL